MARFSALRAATRMARRDAWRSRGRSALIALMVALPVLAASAVSVLYRSDQRDPQDYVTTGLGAQAQASLTIGTGSPVEQSIDAQNGGSPGNGSSDQVNTLSFEQFRLKAEALIPSRDRSVVSTHLYSSRSIRFHDRLVVASIRELDYATPGLGGLVQQVSGRAPSAAGEVVLSTELARKHGIRLGDRLSYTPARELAGKTLTVVGIVSGFDLIGDPTVIGPTGSLVPAGLLESDAASSIPFERNLLVLGPDPVTWDQVLDLNQLGSMVLSRSVINHPPSADRVPYSGWGSSGPDAGAVGIGAVVIGLVLLQIALLAGPAIAVGARRNQRSLALMASAGAERKHLRAVVLASSAVIGLVSCALAALLGAGIGALIVLLLRDRFDQALIRVDVHSLDLIGLALVGGLTAVAAALIPARQAARLDVVAALTGRRGQLPPRLRVPVVGLAVSLAGVCLAFAGSASRRAFVAVVGLALTEVGLVAASGAIVALAARLAVRLPFSPRFALRDAARQRARTAPAVAAVLAAIAGGTTALVYVAAQGLHDQRTYTAQTQLGAVIVQDTGNATTAELTKVQAAIGPILPITQIAEYRALSNGPAAVYLQPARSPQNQCPLMSTNTFTPAQTARIARTDARCLPPHHSVKPLFLPINSLFDDGTALALLTGQPDRADTAALSAGKVLLFDPLDLWPDGTVHVSVHREAASGSGTSGTSDGGTGTDQTVTLPARLATGTQPLSAPVYPLTAAKALGVPMVASGLIASTSRMPTQAEQDKASAAAHDVADVYLNVERGYQDRYEIGLLALVVAAAVVTLGGTFTAVGLAAAEGRADVATLAAVGASPGVRRRLAASQAGVIAGLGAVLGVASGILAGWILVRMQVDNSGDGVFYDASSSPSAASWQLVLPWRYLLATGLGVPGLAVAIGFLTTRSRLPVVRRLGQ